MRGRPKKEVTRDIIYRIRLNDKENELFTRISVLTHQTKAEVFRKALLEYSKTLEE